MGAGIAGGIGLLVYGRDDFKTPGIKNIENRHAAAGGSHSSTPAQASKMGDQEDGAGRHGGDGEFVTFPNLLWSRGLCCCLCCGGEAGWWMGSDEVG